jgi:8-oxo-dGTP pyrophosphatase MutT (NUDIX family)
VVEKGEAPLDAAKRELLEETGYTGGVWQPLMTLSANPGTMTNLTHCYVATGVEKTSEQHLDATEDLTVHLLSREEVLALVCEGRMVPALMLAPLLKHFSGL